MLYFETVKSFFLHLSALAASAIHAAWLKMPDECNKSDLKLLLFS